MRLDVIHVVVRLHRVDRRQRSAERGRNVEDAEAGAAGRTRAGATSRAERRIRSKSCVFSIPGRAVHTHAVAAATCGAEKLVPLIVLHMAGLTGSCHGICSPGAARSTAGLVLEKSDG